MKKSKETEKKRVTVGLLWHSLTSDNLGVGALTESQIAICQNAAQKTGVEIEFIVFGTSGGSEYTPLGLTIRKGSRISIKQMLLGRSPFLLELEQCDFVLDIGEGDSFTDIYGFKRFIFLFVSKLAVILKNKPLILSPQTIGPFDHWLSRFFAILVMNRCTKLYARDGQSHDYLTHLKIAAEIDEAIDVAFRLPYQQSLTKNTTTQVQIGINVSGLLFSGGYTGNNQFGLTLDYAELIRELIQEWSKHPDYQIWLIPHVLPDDYPEEDDRIAINSLLKEFPQVKRAHDFSCPSEAKSFISGMDFVTGARMHACIAAFSSGVPVVPLAYSRKFNGLFNSLNYQWIADGKSMNNRTAFDQIMNGFKQRELLSEQVKKGCEIARNRLNDYENFISQQLILA